MAVLLPAELPISKAFQPFDTVEPPDISSRPAFIYACLKK
jgi:hypothetical protein